MANYIQSTTPTSGVQRNFLCFCSNGNAPPFQILRIDSAYSIFSHLGITYLLQETSGRLYSQYPASFCAGRVPKAISTFFLFSSTLLDGPCVLPLCSNIIIIIIGRTNCI